MTGFAREKKNMPHKTCMLSQRATWPRPAGPPRREHLSIFTKNFTCTGLAARPLPNCRIRHFQELPQVHQEIPAGMRMHMRTQPPMLSLLCALAMAMALRALKGPESLLPPAPPACRAGVRSQLQRNTRGHQARLHPKVRAVSLSRRLAISLSRCPYPPPPPADRGKGRLGARPAIAPWAALIALKSIATATRRGISACDLLKLVLFRSVSRMKTVGVWRGRSSA